VVESTEDQAVSRVVRPSIPLGHEMGSIQQLGKRNAARDARRAVPLEYTKLETWLADAGCDFTLDSVVVTVEREGLIF
jgi:hypothetical protein